ncbi:hypothetical protein ACGFZP_16565 [Kitasatospora sp. NPDC048239]|uniref:hypothetical protein n=1 Tax=Kitasatospora sp. NPDC048239 TaxID=3364046 RepID=UPI003711885B
MTAPAPRPTEAAASGSAVAAPPLALLGLVPGRRLTSPALHAALAALAAAGDGAAAATAGRAVAAAHPQALREERAALRAALADPALRAPLIAAAGRADRAVERFLSTGEDEAAALDQLLRATVPSGPPGAHTTVAAVHWAEEGAAMDRTRLDPPAARTTLAVDRAMLATVVDLLLAEAPAPAGPAVGPAAGPAALRVNPTLRSTPAQARFHRRDGDQLRLIGTPLTRRVRTLLRLLELGPLPRAALVRELATALEVEESAAEAFTEEAVRLQLLLPAAAFGAPETAGAAAALLAGPRPEAAKVLAAVQDRLDAATGAGPQERTRALTGLAEDRAALNRLLPYPVPLPVAEESVSAPVAVAAGRHRSALDDLGPVLEYAAAFDPTHEARALLTAAFTERFGRGARVRLHVHAEDLVTMVARRAQLLTGATAADFGPADGSLTGLLRLRSAARHRLAERIGAGRAAGRAAGRREEVEEVQVDPAWLAALVDGLPERFRSRPGRYAVAVEPLGDGLAVRGFHPGGGVLADRLPRPSAPDQPGPTGLIDPSGWLRLVLAHDPDRDELALLDEDGAAVAAHRPAPARPGLLAAPLRIAWWLGGTGRLRPDPLGDAAALARDTIALPRLRAGRVLLQGRRWYPGAGLPAGHGAELIGALTRWRSVHGVPEQVLLAGPALPGDDPDGVYGPATADFRPRYADLSSALLADTVRALPDGGHLEELPTGVQDGVRDLHWLVEYGRTPDGGFRLGGTEPGRTEPGRTEPGGTDLGGTDLGGAA